MFEKRVITELSSGLIQPSFIAKRALAQIGFPLPAKKVLTILYSLTFTKKSSKGRAPLSFWEDPYE
jgi:hypothetical protein